MLYYLYYIQPISANVNASTIAIEPFKVWSHNVTSIPLTLVSGTLFPAAYIIINLDHQFSIVQRYVSRIVGDVHIE